VRQRPAPGPAETLTSAAAIEALKPLEARVPPGDLPNALGHAVRQARSALHDITDVDPSLEGTGTRLTAAEQPEAAVAQLIELANQAVGPDNIACAVADSWSFAPAEGPVYRMPGYDWRR
jgi:hypothetical protein